MKLEGDIQQGITHYKKALLYNWHYADAMYNLGVAYGEQLKFDMVSLNRVPNMPNLAMPISNLRSLSSVTNLCSNAS